MKRTYRLRVQSQKEVRQAACWYESERRGLGKEFRKAVQHDPINNRIRTISGIPSAAELRRLLN